jgi:DNA-binding CsgD family transcriptional regulator/tetratricopeptide (TPR) repeat protein
MRAPAFSQLLDREAEMQRISATLQAVRDGQGSLVFAEGVPGMGKTTLLEAAATGARAEGFMVLDARGALLEQTFAFGVCLQLFRDITGRPDATRLLGGPGLHARKLLEGRDPTQFSPAAGHVHFIYLGLATLCLNLAAQAPLLISIDDIHWADEQSLRFIHFLSRRIADRRVFVLVAARGPESESEPMRVLRDAARGAILNLKPLSADAVSRLVRGAIDRADDDLCQWVWHGTGGNPFYISCVTEEFVRNERRGAVVSAPAAHRRDAAPGLPAQLTPRAIADAVILRAAELGRDARSVMDAVAVLGDRKPLSVIARMAELPVARTVTIVQRLGDADILTPDSAPSFAHPIVRETVYGELSGARRAREHVRAARFLHDAAEDPETVAAHLLRGTRSAQPWVAEALSSAASRALSRGAPDVATRYLQRAIEEPPPAEMRRQLMHSLGRAELLAGRPSAVTALREAVDLSSPGRSTAETSRSLAEAYTQLGRLEEAMNVYGAAIETLPDEEHELRLQLQAEAAAAGRHGPTTFAAAARTMEQAISGEGTVGQTPAQRLVLANLVGLRMRAGATAAEVAAIAEQALSGGLISEQTSGAPSVYNALFPLVLTDRYETALRFCEEALADAETRGSMLGLCSALCCRSHLRWRLGELDGAKADAWRLVESVRETGLAIAEAAHSFLLDALTDGGQWDEAEAALEAGGLQGSIPNLYLANFLLLARARLRVASGRLESAIVDLRELDRRRRDWPGGDPRVPFHRTVLAEALAMNGQPDEARAVAEDAMAHADDWDTPRAKGIALRAIGMCTAGPEGITHLKRSADYLESARAPVELAYTHLALGSRLRRAGKRADARDPLRRAMLLAERHGATAIRDRGRDELLAAGGRPRRTHLSGVDALTPSESRVARLAASGLSNREIAQQLYLSPRTVEMHLRNAYGKLEVPSRGHLAAALERG